MSGTRRCLYAKFHLMHVVRCVLRKRLGFIVRTRNATSKFVRFCNLVDLLSLLRPGLAIRVGVVEFQANVDTQGILMPSVLLVESNCIANILVSPRHIFLLSLVLARWAIDAPVAHLNIQ